MTSKTPPYLSRVISFLSTSLPWLTSFPAGSTPSPFRPQGIGLPCSLCTRFLGSTRTPPYFIIQFSGKMSSLWRGLPWTPYLKDFTIPTIPTWTCTLWGCIKKVSWKLYFSAHPSTFEITIVVLSLMDYCTPVHGHLYPSSHPHAFPPLHLIGQ